MPDLAITVNGRSYRIGCAEGEQDRLAAIGRELDRRVGGLVQQFGQVGEAQLLATVAVMLLDELDEARLARGAAGAGGDARVVDARGEAGREGGREQRVANLLDDAARRLEQLADRLEQP